MYTNSVYRDEDVHSSSLLLHPHTHLLLLGPVGCSAALALRPPSSPIFHHQQPPSEDSRETAASLNSPQGHGIPRPREQKLAWQHRRLPEVTPALGRKGFRVQGGYRAKAHKNAANGSLCRHCKIGHSSTLWVSGHMLCLVFSGGSTISGNASNWHMQYLRQSWLVLWMMHHTEAVCYFGAHWRAHSPMWCCWGALEPDPFFSEAVPVCAIHQNRMHPRNSF